jgi:cell division transport system permease protein
MRQINSKRSEGYTDAYEICIRNKKGEKKWWLISGAPNIDEFGHDTGSIGIHWDITLQKELGENFVDFLGYNPLKPSIIISFKSKFTEKILLKSTIIRIAANPLIEDVQYQESLISELNENLKTIAIILLSFTSLLIIVAIGLINNTIRIALYSQRQLIRSMLLVGAKKNFIRKPFLIDSVRNGVLGGVFSIIILLTCIYFAEKKIADLKNLIDTNTLLQVGGLLLSCGVVLSFTCTLIALNRHLKYRTNLL